MQDVFFSRSGNRRLSALATLLLFYAPMPQARRAASSPKRSTATALSNSCAVWLILLALSPFTAPFSVCEPGDVAITDTTSRHLPSPASGVNASLMDGAVVSDLPLSPVAAKIDAAATSMIRGNIAPLDATPAIAAPFIARPPSSAPPVLVLRV